MSDNRKILVAKRKHERSVNNFKNKGCTLGDLLSKKPIKRAFSPNNTPTKNLANSRLKRLRASLNEEVEKRVHKSNVSNNLQTRKRSQILETRSDFPVKIPKCNTSNIFTKPSTTVRASKEDINERIIVPSSLETINKVSEQVSSSENEDMEWSAADNNDADRFDGNLLNSVTHRDLYIVTDTNIFISQLPLVKDIVEMNITGSKKPIIFIPWIVFEELDFIKEDLNKTSLKWKAQEAIKYIEKTLGNKSDRLRGQTLNEANEQNDAGKSQDNKIIACCLQVLEKYQNMVLLTNDINLRNKAHVNHVPVCSHNEILIKIKMELNNQTRSQVILQKMTSLCQVVINQCAESAYGQAYKKMPICQTSPQTLHSCIQIFRKYWFPVFQEVLMKQFRKAIDDLHTFLTDNKSVKDNSKELDDLLRLCVRVCIFLKDVNGCKNIIESTIRDLNNIKGS